MNKENIAIANQTIRSTRLLCLSVFPIGFGIFFTKHPFLFIPWLGGVCYLYEGLFYYRLKWNCPFLEGYISADKVIVDYSSTTYKTSYQITGDSDLDKIIKLYVEARSESLYSGFPIPIFIMLGVIYLYLY
jgi:hypothetical protein